MLAIKRAADIDWDDMSQIESPMLAKYDIENTFYSPGGIDSIWGLREILASNAYETPVEDQSSLQQVLDALEWGSIFLLKSNPTSPLVLWQKDDNHHHGGRWVKNPHWDNLLSQTIDSMIKQVKPPGQHAANKAAATTSSNEEPVDQSPQDQPEQSEQPSQQESLTDHQQTHDGNTSKEQSAALPTPSTPISSSAPPEINQPTATSTTAAAINGQNSADVEADVETDVTPVEEPPQGWIKVQAYYDDKWQTPLPLERLTIAIDNQALFSDVALNSQGNKSTTSSTLVTAQATAQEAGVIVKKDLPNGNVLVKVEREAGLEAEIDALRHSLQTQLDGAYRATVINMAAFQQNWDDYSYGAIAIDGASGLYQGASKWLDDQADLFEVQTWSRLGNIIASAAGSVYDTAATYAQDPFKGLRENANQLSQWAEENQDNLLNWHWHQTNAQDALDSAQQGYLDGIGDAQQYLNDASDAIGHSAQYINALFTHRNAIMGLFTDIAQGDVNKVQTFVDTVLVDIDPELANTIQQSPDFHLVLALIDDHDSALTYTAYLSLFIEAVPPNFYAHVGGKGGIYLAIEVGLLLLATLLTLGAGTAARVTQLAAKFAANSAKAAGATQKLKQTQSAIQAFSRTVEDFANSADTLKSLGQALTKARSSGLVLKGKTNSTLTSKKQNQKRDTRCRRCNRTDHQTPRPAKNKGNIDYV